MSAPKLTGWFLAPFESTCKVQHRAAFRGWVHSGERFDYASVEIDPPLEPTETGISISLSRVILAPRHEGVYLDHTPQRWPVHVYLLTAPDQVLDSGEIPADALSIRAWGLLTGPIDVTDEDRPA